jgi:preprotein translocase subunit SecB
MSEPKLIFKAVQIVKVILDRTDGADIEQFDVDLQHATQFRPESNTHFRATFVITLKPKDSPSSSFLLQVQAFGEFEIIADAEITKNVFDNYVRISAPSIVYPYIRAFIGNFLMQTGSRPVILPPMNFAMPQAPVLEGQQPQKSNLPAG